MYNLQIATKIKKQLKNQRLSQLKQHQYIERYSKSIQPKLLDNYNKRINTFLQKMEENPVIITEYQESSTLHQQKDKLLGSEIFKFKDHTDWNSIYTSAERSQRKLNSFFMKEKFGDPLLAYRSIASNSEYVSTFKHQFRIRKKNKQINPPMKYATLIPSIMIKKLQQKQKTLKIRTEESKSNKKIHSEQPAHPNKSLVSKNSLNFDEDNRSVRSFRSFKSFPQSVMLKNDEIQPNNHNEQLKGQTQKSGYKSDKIHFKTLVEAYEKCSDTKIKQNMRQVLVKCKVFRIKDKKIQENQIDKLSFQIDKPSSNHVTIKIDKQK